MMIIIGKEELYMFLEEIVFI